MKNLTWQNPEQLFVAQELINKVKSKCCGIKDYENLKFGFLSSTRIQGKYSWSEGRFSANVAPVKWFDASVNYAVSSFGSSFGWLINFHPKGFNLFIGSDHQFFKITPQFVPVNRANANLAMGINFNF